MYRIIGADGREYGPVSADQLRQWIAEGRVNADTKIFAEGGADWRPAGTFPELSVFFAVSRPPAPASTRQSHPLATTGLVLGILSFTVGFCCCYGLPFSIPGLVCSILGMVQIRREPQRYSGEGMAIAGIILSVLSLLGFGLLFAIGLLGSGSGILHHRGFRL